MNPILSKTLGGLSKKYYFRQFLFGLIFPILFYFIFTQSEINISGLASLIALVILSTLLYPYSRFVYESIINFIFGGNVFLVNAILLLIVKFITMFLCWIFAIFIAPIGLIYLYYYHTKNEKNKQNQSEE